jgi:hypothetical protein
VPQLGDVRRYPSFVERQCLGNSCIARIGMTVDVTEALAV